MSTQLDAQPMFAEHADFHCRLCGSSNLYLYYALGNRGECRYYKCRACKLVNYDLRGGLDQEQFTDLIDPTDETAPRHQDKDMTWRFIERYFPTPGRFFDIGCGTGRLLWLAKRAGWSVAGLDLLPAMAELAARKTGADVRAADFLELEPRPGERYDLVALRHVLEHLPDSVRAMTMIDRLLEPGGHALLEFPNIEAADKRIKRWLVRSGLHKRRFKAGFQAGHCNEFCRSSFDYLLGKTGFTLVRWETYSAKPLANFIYNRLHVGNKARALIRKNETRP